MNHLSNSELQEFVDSKCDEKSRSRISSHLQECSECRSRVVGLEKLSHIISQIPREKVSAKFTERVMGRITTAKSSSFLWFLFKNIAPVFGLIIVIGMVYLGLILGGIIGGSGVEQSGGTVSAVFDKVGGDISDATSAFADWFKRVFPFFYTDAGRGLAVVLLILALAAILDKYLLVPLFRRRG
jgi:hypothetical protein